MAETQRQFSVGGEFFVAVNGALIRESPLY
jgi:hypothetical protein